MKLFQISGLKCLEQNIIEHKLGDMFDVSLQEDTLEGDDRSPITISISGREDNLFEMDKVYVAHLISGYGDDTSSLNNENDVTEKYKVLSLCTDIDREEYYNLTLTRRNHPDDPKDTRYEEIVVSGLIPSSELLSIKAGDMVVFEIKELR